MQHRFATILLVLMAIMPVVVAFAHYSVLASQLSVAQMVVAADDMDDGGGLASKHADHCQSATAKPHLASCSFHVCVDCAITTSFGFFPIHGALVTIALRKYLPLFRCWFPPI
ncbi:hypothetical protein A1353_08085 [Methylomonas methanica]|uniref:Uncharacterized protein n=1 Tax=Methylomonas methanica TaxID=421 RepID=A0A177MNH0_METMH|nr:hypothetical protein A1353_08085 [Methylomonas methanica]PKM13683.1 MAG: hypothetical protein CVV13_00315 [Gammaproteobacteria bacterium HGW-Gammaproteobacteria-3]